MVENLDSYQALYQFRQESFVHHADNNEQLNTQHDELIQRALQIAINKVNARSGPSPTEFAFFMMGSAGRQEQGIWSDQDHGIVYLKESPQAQAYFQALGAEITDALDLVGYEKCEGRVMCSNPKWCRSLQQWHIQIQDWIETNDWDSIRHLLVFTDSRVLVGSYELLAEVRQQLFNTIIDSPSLLKRMLQNTQRIKKAIGLLGQFFVEQHGPYTGCLNMKDTAFFPYVNMARLLAVKERILSTSTQARFEEVCTLPKNKVSFGLYKEYYEQLLNLRLDYQKKHFPSSYEASHYINIAYLSKEQKKELKLILQGGIDLNKITNQIIEKGC